MIEWISPDEFLTHPLNQKIYGDAEPDELLVESMQKNGYFQDQPVGYVASGRGLLLVSGHRRIAAAKKVGLEHVAAVRLESIEGSDNEIIKHAILSNRQRIKTPRQIALEIKHLSDIERSSNPKKSDWDVATSVSKKTGVPTRTVMSLAKAGAILESGQPEEAEQIEKALSSSVRKTKKAVEDIESARKAKANGSDKVKPSESAPPEDKSFAFQKHEAVAAKLLLIAAKIVEADKELVALSGVPGTEFLNIAGISNSLRIAAHEIKQSRFYSPCHVCEGEAIPSCSLCSGNGYVPYSRHGV